MFLKENIIFLRIARVNRRKIEAQKVFDAYKHDVQQAADMMQGKWIKHCSADEVKSAYIHFINFKIAAGLNKSGMVTALRQHFETSPADLNVDQEDFDDDALDKV